MTILLDGSSTHCFVKPTIAKTQSKSIKSHKLFRVRIANGKELAYNQWIPAMKWSMQGYQFLYNVYVLDLEPYDLILGVDWMKSYSPMTFDFKELTLSFENEGENVLLRNDSQTSQVKMKQGHTANKYMRKKVRSVLQHSCMVKVRDSQVTSIPNSLLKLLRQYDDIFAEPKYLPPSR